MFHAEAIIFTMSILHVLLIHLLLILIFLQLLLLLLLPDILDYACSSSSSSSILSCEYYEHARHPQRYYGAPMLFVACLPARTSR